MLGAQELKAIADAKSSPPSEPSSNISSGLDSNLASHRLQDDSSVFVIHISTAVQKGEGAFAARDIQKGDLILSERPIVCLPAPVPEPLRRISIEAVVRNLSPINLDSYLSLQHLHDTCSSSGNPLLDIFARTHFVFPTMKWEST